jgi:hypothetical protein
LKQATTLLVLKQSFRYALPDHDGRTALSPLAFVTGIVFCFLSDTKSFSLEAMRRFLIGHFEVTLSKGAFWERLSGHRLKRQLHQVLAELMNRLSARAVIDQTWLGQLNVNGIYLIDSSTLSLWHGAHPFRPFQGKREALCYLSSSSLMRPDRRATKRNPNVAIARSG